MGQYFISQLATQIIMHPYLNIAIKAARSAGNIIVRSMDRLDRIDISTKSGPNDFVTSVDRASEAEIINTIMKAYPDHGILGEESGGHVGTNINEVVWIIDPLDGTMNFVHSFPHFAISIGIQIRGVMEHGVVYNPVTNELFTATKGSGAQLDGRRIRVSDCKTMETALVCTGFSPRRKEEDHNIVMQRLQRVLGECADVRRTGSAALDLAYVAAGRLDGFWESSLGPWDMAAGSLLVREAGGFVGDFNGDEKFLDSGKIIAATTKVYPSLLKLMN